MNNEEKKSTVEHKILLFLIAIVLFAGIVGWTFYSALGNDEWVTVSNIDSVSFVDGSEYGYHGDLLNITSGNRSYICYSSESIDFTQDNLTLILFLDDGELPYMIQRWYIMKNSMG